MKFSSYLIFLVFILVTSCSPTPQGIEPSSTSTKRPQPTATETPRPTPTLTATVTATVTAIPSPTPTATPQVPEEFGEIAYTEMHDGEKYAIDKYDRAVAVFQAGEWISFERPVVSLANGRFTEDMIVDSIRDVLPEDEKRLVMENGEVLPYGFILDEEYGPPRNETVRNVAFISGILQGAILSTDENYNTLTRSVVTVEVPLKYQRFVLEVNIPYEQTFSNFYKIPESGVPLNSEGQLDYKMMEDIESDAHKLNVYPIGVSDVVRMLQKEESLGKQIVIGFVYKDEEPSDDNWAYAFSVYQDAISGMERGKFDTDRYYIDLNMGIMWVPESILE